MNNSLLKREISALRAKLRRYKQALDFYADYPVYMLPAEDRPGMWHSPTATYARPILNDGGRRARRALGEEADDG